MATFALLSVSAMTSLRVELVGKRWALAAAVLLSLSSPLAPVVAAELRPGMRRPGQLAPRRSSDPMLQDDAYILGAGDGLSLKFLAVTTSAVPWRSSTTAPPPCRLLGSVRLSGLTLSQASLWLESLYRKQLQRPDLQLSVVRPRPLRIAVVGEVERPASTPSPPRSLHRGGRRSSISGLPTLVDAIQKAGGITAMANLRRVVVQRRLPGADSRFKRARVNLLALVRDGDQLQNPLLFDGDTIRLERVSEQAGRPTPPKWPPPPWRPRRSP